MHPGLADILADVRPEPAASPATEACFLMCPPRHYAVSYSINPWMNPGSWKSDGSALHEEAEQQWFTLHDTLLALGAAIDFVDPEPNLPDLVFTANAAIVLDGKSFACALPTSRTSRRGADLLRRALRAKGTGGD